jgi:hypothetical protein
MSGLYDFSIPLFLRGFAVLTHIIDKATAYAEEHKIAADDMAGWKLVDDMKPFSFQIQVATNTVKFVLARVLQRTDMPVFADDETTLAQLRARVEKLVELVKSVKAEDFKGRENQETVLPSAKGDRKLTGLTYLQGYAVPNFYFHVVTAYDILRAKGVQVGKSDFLRPGEA